MNKKHLRELGWILVGSVGVTLLQAVAQFDMNQVTDVRAYAVGALVMAVRGYAGQLVAWLISSRLEDENASGQRKALPLYKEGEEGREEGGKAEGQEGPAKDADEGQDADDGGDSDDVGLVAEGGPLVWPHHGKGHSWAYFTEEQLNGKRRVILKCRHCPDTMDEYV